jgi:hypothetical protein
MCLPVSRLFWISSLAYPSLLGIKGYVVVDDEWHGTILTFLFGCHGWSLVGTDSDKHVRSLFGCHEYQGHFFSFNATTKVHI